MMDHLIEFGVCLVCGVAAYMIVCVPAMCANRRFTRDMRAERRRLERCIREYNRMYGDDYEPFDQM